MKTKLVLWGENAQDERVLIALELLPEENKVKLYTFPETVATEEFSQAMMDKWRNDEAFDMPEGHLRAENPLTVTDSLLPDDLKVERTDVIMRAQAEWHFVVLSSKLNATYHSELEEIRDRVEQLRAFDNKMWEELKGFWDKVQSQVTERNLFRDHANALREKTNDLFGTLKTLRVKMDEEFQEKSRESMAKFQEKLAEIENKMSQGSRLAPLFDELKELQRKFRDIEFTRDHRSKVWEHLDKTFKLVKEKRFGASASSSGNAGDGQQSAMERLQRRFEGLMSAIDKMERSIKRDREDMDFQDRRGGSGGQLEEQLRQAKTRMVEERVRSKEEKLDEMLQTKAELEKRIAQQRKRDAEREARQKVEEAKRAAEAKIAEEIKAAAAARVDSEEVLEKAAEAIKQPKPQEKPAPKESLMGAIGTLIGEAMEDAVDTAKAVAEVVSHHMGEAIEEAKEKVGAVVDDLKDRAEEAMEGMKDKAAAAKDKAEDIAEDLADKAEGAMEAAKDKAEDAVAAAKDMAAAAEDRAEDLADKAEDATEAAKDKAEDMASDLADKAAETIDTVKEEAAAAASDATDAVADAIEDLPAKDSEGEKV